MRILDTRSVLVKTTETLSLQIHGNGSRIIKRGGMGIASEGPDDHTRMAEFALRAAPLKDKSVAWIGGGLCLGPRLFAIADCRQTVYEIEPTLAEFCPKGITFVPGDWAETISGKFDIIVFDIEGDPPTEHLEKFLNPGGKILP